MRTTGSGLVLLLLVACPAIALSQTDAASVSVESDASVADNDASVILSNADVAVISHSTVTIDAAITATSEIPSGDASMGSSDDVALLNAIDASAGHRSNAMEPLVPAIHDSRAGSSTVDAGVPATETTPTKPPKPKDDDGRTMDILFIQPEFGASYAHLGAFQRQGRLQPGLVEFLGWGWHGGLTMGFRLWLFAVAAHGSISRFDGTGINVANLTMPMSSTPAPANFDLGQVTVDGHLRIPLPIIEPYVRIGIGYAWMGAFQINERYRESTLPVHGWTAKLGAGADFWIGKWFSLGAGFDVSVINLRRGGVTTPTSTCPTSDPTCVDLTMDGNAFGVNVLSHIQLALHL